MTELELLEPPWPEVFELMSEAYVARTIPVGAVVAEANGTVVARGRNRIFAPPHDGRLAGTRLGHAEINALVGLTSERVYPDLTLYTALEPCHGVLDLYRRLRPDLVELAERLPSPPEATTLVDAVGRLTK